MRVEKNIITNEKNVWGGRVFHTFITCLALLRLRDRKKFHTCGIGDSPCFLVVTVTYDDDLEVIPDSLLRDSFQALPQDCRTLVGRNDDGEFRLHAMYSTPDAVSVFGLRKQSEISRPCDREGGIPLSYR